MVAFDFAAAGGYWVFCDILVRVRRVPSVDWFMLIYVCNKILSCCNWL